MARWRALLLVLLSALFKTIVASSSKEEEEEDAKLVLSNFQGGSTCAHDQGVAFPNDETEVNAVLESRTTGMVRVVRATSGNAHSWNEKFWCARTSDEEKEEECVNVFMNDVRVVRGRVRVIRGGEKVYAVCDAGVKVRDVLEYIAERGYALKSIPWFIDQTVGGALATCTHGSSLVFGSLSSQVVGLRTMLYNGTVETVTERTHGENVMNAFRCHANQLGITLAATFEVIEESEAQRINRKVHPTDCMLKEIEMASAAVRRCVELYKDNDKIDWLDSCAMQDYAIRSLDDVSYYYFVPTEEAQRVKIRREIPSSSLSSRRGSDNASDDVPNEDYLLVTSASSSPARMLEEYYFKASSVGSSASRQRVQNPNTIRNRLMQNDDLVFMWTNLWQDALEPSLRSTVASNTSHAYLAMTENQLDRNDNYPFDQSELAIPLTNAGECLRGFIESMTEKRRKYWRSPVLIRFLNAESALLSPAHNQPSMYVNMENYKRSEEGKESFRDAIRYLTSNEKCEGRLHFGKFGWDDESYSLYDKYGDAYCKFLCVKDAYDPLRRFETREMSRIFGKDKDKCRQSACAKY